MGEFPASCGRETDCRFAVGYVQAFRTTTIVCGAFTGWANFLRRANVKQAAASRGLRSSIPDNDDCLRCFRGMDGFLASRGRETGCRFAVGYVQAFRTTAVSQDGRIFFSARALRSSIPDDDPSSAKRLDCPANLPQEVRGRFFLLNKPILGGYACRSYTLWRPPLAT